MNLLFSSLNEVHQNHKEGINLFEEKRYVVKVPKKNYNEQEQGAPSPEEPTQRIPQPPAQPAQPAQPSTPVAPSNLGRPGLVKRNGAPTQPEPIQTPSPTPPQIDVDVEEPDMGGGGMGFDSEVDSIERELGGGEESPEKEIQSLTGKLGQALRQGEAEQVVDTELTKYVVNSVFSALNIGELTDEDKLEESKRRWDR